MVRRSTGAGRLWVCVAALEEGVVAGAGVAAVLAVVAAGPVLLDVLELLAGGAEAEGDAAELLCAGVALAEAVWVEVGELVAVGESPAEVFDEEDGLPVAVGAAGVLVEDGAPGVVPAGAVVADAGVVVTGPGMGNTCIMSGSSSSDSDGPACARATWVACARTVLGRAEAGAGPELEGDAVVAGTEAATSAVAATV